MSIRKILVVDDSATERYFLGELLMRAGYTVMTAGSSEQALEVIRAELPDLVLMDVIMPGTNGYSATRVIARDPSLSHIPVILVTSKSGETDRIWGLRQGAADYIVKPVDGRELLAKISALQE